MVFKEKNVEKAKNHLTKLTISEKNKQFILRYIKQQAANNIIKTKRQMKYYYLLGKIAQMVDKDFDKLTKDDITDLCADINNSSLSEWTKHDRLVAIKQIIRFVHEEMGETFEKHEYPAAVKGIKTTIKVDSIRKPTDLLKPDDVKLLANNTINLRDRSLILTIFESGGRVAEIQNIKVKDVVFDKYGALLSLHGKTGTRTIRLISSPPSISNWLLEHPGKNEPDFRDKYLFCSFWGKNRGGMLSYEQINLLLRDAAKKAGIAKPVNPHWFRHSRATMLAKDYPEAFMCEFFGWRKGSKEVGTYTHLAARDIDNIMLKKEGLKTDDEEPTFQPIVCPRCMIKNDPASKFCSHCSLALDQRSIIEFDKQKESATDLGFKTMEMLKDPEFVIRFGNLLAEEYKKLKK